jgi:hypothetical protein
MARQGLHLLLSGSSPSKAIYKELTCSSLRVRRPLPPARPVSAQYAAPVPAQSTPVPSIIVEGTPTDAPAAVAALEAPVVGLVPHGSLTPLPLPAPQTRPSININPTHKDINGNDLFDLDIDSLGDKPWRRPGANPADWFNYGMNEPAWKGYVAKQRKVRDEEGAGANPFAVRTIHLTLPSLSPLPLSPLSLSRAILEELMHG